MKALNPPKNKPSHDIVMTPVFLSKKIIDHYLKSIDCSNLSILDPAKGKGAFYDNYPNSFKYKYWCELEYKKDFFKFNNKVDWIITNPPWSKMREFLIHGMKVSDNIVYLSIFNHFTTKARFADLKKYNFGLKEALLLETPKTNWPQSGFQLVAMHIEKDYKGPLFFSN